MPPSPIITVTADPRIFHKVCIDLEIEPPRLVIKRDTKASKAYGICARDGKSISLFTNMDEYDRNRLMHVQSELVITLLHELRHAWQAKHAPEKYLIYHTDISAKQWCEYDAENWATVHHTTYRGIVTVKRRFPHSRMSQLAKAEQAVRQPL